MTSRIAIATAAEFPDLDEDGSVLIDALAERDLAAEPAVWSDADVDWAAYDLVLVRATWDYAPRRDEFVAWARRVESATRLANSAAVIEWNTDKTYLRALADAGLPVVPTDWLTPGDTFTPPGHDEYVVKPAISAGSKDTNRYRAGEHDDWAATHANDLVRVGRTVMIQPYLRNVDTAGETALLYFGGSFSHAVRKGPLLTPAMEPVAGAYREEEIETREPSAAEHEIAYAVLDALADLAPAGRDSLPYARVDLVPDHDGRPILLELELVEPSMFLVHDGGDGSAAAGRFADAVAAMLG